MAFDRITTLYVAETGGRPPVAAAQRGVRQWPQQASESHGGRDSSARIRAMRVLLEAVQALNAAVTERDVVRALAERAPTLCEADFASIGLHQGGEFRYLQQI